jgi:hypothetical protein
MLRDDDTLPNLARAERDALSGLKLYQVNQSRYEQPSYCETYQPEELTVSPAPPAQNVAPDAEVTLSVEVTSGTPPFTYQWYKDGEAILGAVDSTYAFVYDGVEADYSVVVSNACGETSGLATTTATGEITIGG